MGKTKVSAETAQVINESNKVKGAKVSKCVNSMQNTPTRKETKQSFLEFVKGKEDISLSKFFRLFNDYKVENPLGYSEYISSHNMNLAETYDFSWFVTNCPKDENGSFAKWVKVSEKVEANKDSAYNRTTEKGVVYTLVAYPTLKANYEQFETILSNVVSNVKRIAAEAKRAEAAAKRAEAAAKRAAEQHKKNLKMLDGIYKEIEAISINFDIPFDKALAIYQTSKGVNYSDELRSMMVSKFNEKTETKAA